MTIRIERDHTWINDRFRVLQLSVIASETMHEEGTRRMEDATNNKHNAIVTDWYPRASPLSYGLRQEAGSSPRRSLSSPSPSLLQLTCLYITRLLSREPSPRWPTVNSVSQPYSLFLQLLRHHVNRLLRLRNGEVLLLLADFIGLIGEKIRRLSNFTLSQR